MYELDYQDYLIGLIVGLPGLIYVGVMYELDYQNYLIGLIVGLPGLIYVGVMYELDKYTRSTGCQLTYKYMYLNE